MRGLFGFLNVLLRQTHPNAHPKDYSERSDHPFPPPNTNLSNCFNQNQTSQKNKQHQPADLLNKKKHPKPQPPFTSLLFGWALLPLLKALTAHAHALGACVKGVAVLLLSAFKAIPKARRSVRTRRCKANKASNSKEAKRTCGRWYVSFHKNQ